MPIPTLPPREFVTPDTPLRIAVAAALAFPDGSMSAAVLLGQAKNGRLDIQQIGRRYYTTLRAIEAMREKCRVDPRGRDYGCAQHGGTLTALSLIPPHGSSVMPDIAAARDAALMTLEELSENLRGTSRPSVSGRKRDATVVPIKSRSRTSSRPTART